NATLLPGLGSNDVFVAKFDLSGNFVWAKSAGGPGYDYSRGLDVDARGNIVLAGTFAGTGQFGQFNLTSAGAGDIFVGKIGFTPPAITAQPLGGNVLAGQNLTLTVGVTNATGAVTYQWRFNGTNLAGATNATLTLANAGTNAAGTYDVLVTHAFGAVYSAPAVISVIPSANPLPFVLAKNLGGSGSGSLNSMARDANGNYYFGGLFQNALDLGTTNLVSLGSTDAFVAKADATGTVLWAAQFGGPGADSVNGVAVAPNGDVLAVGLFRNGAMFGTNGPVASPTTFPSAFTVRLSPSGQLLWFRRVLNPSVSGSPMSQNSEVVVDAAGNAFVTGKGIDTLSFDEGATTVTHSVGWDYVVKYDTNGNVTLVTNTGDVTGGQYIHDDSQLAMDAAGNLILGGAINSAGHVSVGGVNLPFPVKGNLDAFVAKFTSTGSAIWVRSISGPGQEYVSHVAASPDGSTYVLGAFDAASDFGNGVVLTPDPSLLATGFLLKLATNGAVEWSCTVGSGKFTPFGALAVDRFGNVYVGTVFSGTNTLGIPNAVSVGGDDAMIAKFDPQGRLVWAQSFGAAGGDYINGLALDPSQNIYFGGSFGGIPGVMGSGQISLAQMSAVAPIILASPLSQTIAVNRPVTFSANAAGSGVISYQWQFNGADIPGATNSSYLIPTVVPGSGGNYGVLIGDAFGITNTAPAYLTVDTSGVPFILTPPQTQTAQQGTAVTLTVGAVGAQPLSYQWRFNGTNLPGQIYSFLPLGGVTTNAAGSYTVVVTNTFGAVTSAPAVLSVIQIFAPVITNAPQSQAVLAGTNVTFSVACSGTPPFSYQWVFAGFAIPGNDQPTLTITNVSLADAGNYFVQVFNSGGLASSATATLTVQAPPAFLTVPQNAVVLQGGTTLFTAEAIASPPPGYQWFRNGVPLTNSVNYANVTQTNLLVFNAQAAQGGTYTVVVTNAVGSLTSAPVTLTVLLAPVITMHPTNVTLLRTNPTDILPVTLTVAASGAAPLLYQWRFNGSDLPGETNTTLLLTNVTRLENGFYSAAVTNIAGGAVSSNALVRVRLPQRVAPPVFTPGSPFRLRFGDADGGLAGPVDLSKLEVQATTNLLRTNSVWVTLTNGFSVVNGMLQFDDPSVTNLVRRYYRVIEK
ncbi:MAG: hypothetical protein EB141_10415, partial [Verrucomicrobia bacterium]|nr:hypothetical protein [Verrucomicrobiota bacterium]